MSEPTLKVTSDFTKNFEAIIKKFKNEQVLVGIPAEDASRGASEKSTNSINNAALLAINNFGSPTNNIPARPVMENGIRNAQDEIAEQFKKALQGALNQGFTAIDVYYEKAGMIAANSIKRAINDQEFQGGGEDNSEPKKSTLRARERRGFKGTKSLVVTGQMRNAITYVVKGKV